MYSNDYLNSFYNLYKNSIKLPSDIMIHIAKYHLGINIMLLDNSPPKKFIIHYFISGLFKLVLQDFPPIYLAPPRELIGVPIPLDFSYEQNRSTDRVAYKFSPHFICECYHNCGLKINHYI